MEASIDEIVGVVVKWADREDRDADPVKFCRTHYGNHTRTRLSREDPGLYRFLVRKKRLNEAIEATDQRFVEAGRQGGYNQRNFGGCPLAYWHEHHPGVSRGTLRKLDRDLVENLQRAGLWDAIPPRQPFFGFDPLAHYHRYYPGCTRGKLAEKNFSLYRRLRKDDLLKHVPTKHNRKANPYIPFT